MEEKSEKILIIDDSDIDRKIIGTNLKEAGYQVYFAENGKDGLQKLREQQFDLVFMDLVMPVMDGFETLKKMKSDSVLRNIPVIISSSVEDMGSIVRCLDIGASDYVTKPFESTLLRIHTKSALVARKIQIEKELLNDTVVSTARKTASFRERDRREYTKTPAEEPEAEEGIGIIGFLDSLLYWLRPYKLQLALLVLPLLVVISFEAGYPISFKFITDDALLKHNFSLLLVIIGVLLIGVLLVALLSVLWDYLYSRLGMALLNDMRINIFHHLQRLSIAFYTRSQAGDITARFNTDLASVENTIMLTLPTTLTQIFSLLLSMAILFVLEWRLAIFASIGLFLSYRTERIVEPRASVASYRMKEQQSQIAAVLQENVSTQPLIKAFQLQTLLIDRFRHQMVRFFRTSSRAFFLDYLLETIPDRSILLFSLITISAGAILTFYNFMSIGELVSFQALLMGAMTSVGELTWALPNMIQAAASTQRIKELLDEKPDVTDAPDSVSLPRLSKEITFNDVFFSYGGDQLILKGLNLTIPANKYIALVGPSGCGKSSVLNLIMRFYDPLKGTVKFDGYDLLTVTQDSLRSQISIVLQESLLFNTTIYENIRMGKLDATEEEIEAAAKAVGIHEFIQERPEKYNTIVGERGGKLSGGQRQRIAIARAIISNPAILLLDEVTSALDPKTTNAINKTLEKIAKDRTVVSVTHKLESAIEVDHIIVLKEGKAVEQGKHKELLNLKGIYYQMWQEFGLELTQRALVGEIDRQAEYTGVEADRLSSHISMLEIQVKTSQQKIHQLQTLNQRWAQLAGTDRLTGIPNKMAFLHALVPQEIQQAQRVNAPVGFILISADNIGPINETYGRDAGDQVIREFAKLLQSIVKGEELLGHIDGTYFCIVLHPADLEATKNRAEILRSQVASFAFPCADYSVNITASIGILSVNSNIVSDPNVAAEEIFQKLCIALYKAKRAGGNRVEITS